MGYNFTIFLLKSTVVFHCQRNIFYLKGSIFFLFVKIARRKKNCEFILPCENDKEEKTVLNFFLTFQIKNISLAVKNTVLKGNM